MRPNPSLEWTRSGMHLAREAPWYMLHLAGQAPCLRAPLSSNVGHHMQRLAFLIAVTAFLGGHASVAQAATSKEDYELQERCGVRAEERFRREWGKEGPVNTSDGQAIVSYRNHYNSRLNKCLALITYKSLPFKAKPPRVSKQMTLFDVNANQDYGFYFKFDDEPSPSDCKVEGKACGSEQEWEALVAPYMSE
jgi:hypothetical protein